MKNIVSLFFGGFRRYNGVTHFSTWIWQRLGQLQHWIAAKWNYNCHQTYSIWASITEKVLNSPSDWRHPSNCSIIFGGGRWSDVMHIAARFLMNYTFSLANPCEGFTIVLPISKETRACYQKRLLRSVSQSSCAYQNHPISQSRSISTHDRATLNKFSHFTQKINFDICQCQICAWR